MDRVQFRDFSLVIPKISFVHQDHIMQKLALDPRLDNVAPCWLDSWRVCQDDEEA